MSSRKFTEASVDDGISARAFGHTAATADNAPADGCLEMAYSPDTTAALKADSSPTIRFAYRVAVVVIVAAGVVVRAAARC